MTGSTLLPTVDSRDRSRNVAVCSFILLLQVFTRFCRIQRQTSSSQHFLNLHFHFHNHLRSRSLSISKPSLFTTDLFIRSLIGRFLLLSNQQVALSRSTFQDEAFHPRLSIGGSVHGYGGCLPSVAGSQLVSSSSSNPFLSSRFNCRSRPLLKVSDQVVI
jgi:hypothetical protein